MRGVEQHRSSCLLKRLTSCDSPLSQNRFVNRQRERNGLPLPANFMSNV